LDDAVTTKQKKKQAADARKKEFANVIVGDERALKPSYLDRLSIRVNSKLCSKHRLGVDKAPLWLQLAPKTHF